MGHRLTARTVFIIVLCGLASSTATGQASASTLQSITSLETQIRELYKQAGNKAAVRPALDQALSALRRSQRYHSQGRHQLAQGARSTAWAALELASRQIAYEAARQAHQEATRQLATEQNQAAAARQALQAALQQRAQVGAQQP